MLARKQRKGFTLVEIMIAVTIIGILCSMALPAFRKVRERTQNTATFNDLRIFSQAFQTYDLAYGKWPLASGPGVLSPEMEGEIKKSFYEKPTPIYFQSRYQWIGPADPAKQSNFEDPAIAVVDANLSPERAFDIDKIFDDGDILTGNLTYEAGGLLYHLGNAPAGP